MLLDKHTIMAGYAGAWLATLYIQNRNRFLTLSLLVVPWINSWTIVKIISNRNVKLIVVFVFVFVGVCVCLCDSPTQCNSLEKIETNILPVFVTNTLVICTKCVIPSYKNIVFGHLWFREFSAFPFWLGVHSRQDVTKCSQNNPKDHCWISLTKFAWSFEKKYFRLRIFFMVKYL